MPPWVEWWFEHSTTPCTTCGSSWIDAIEREEARARQERERRERAAADVALDRLLAIAEREEAERDG